MSRLRKGDKVLVRATVDYDTKHGDDRVHAHIAAHQTLVLREQDVVLLEVAKFEVGDIVRRTEYSRTQGVVIWLLDHDGEEFVLCSMENDKERPIVFRKDELARVDFAPFRLDWNAEEPERQ